MTLALGTENGHCCDAFADAVDNYGPKYVDAVQDARTQLELGQADCCAPQWLKGLAEIDSDGRKIAGLYIAAALNPGGKQ